MFLFWLSYPAFRNRSFTVSGSFSNGLLHTSSRVFSNKTISPGERKIKAYHYVWRYECVPDKNKKQKLWPSFSRTVVNMTFLPVPRQPALFKCWAVQPIELHTPILYIPLQPPPPSRSCIRPPSSPLACHTSLTCTAAAWWRRCAWLLHAWGMITAWCRDEGGCYCMQSRGLQSWHVL